MSAVPWTARSRTEARRSLRPRGPPGEYADLVESIRQVIGRRQAHDLAPPDDVNAGVRALRTETLDLLGACLRRC